MKRLLILLVLAIAIMPLFAFEFRSGVIANVEREYLSNNAKYLVKDIEKYNLATYLNLIGPQIELAFSPLATKDFALGIKALASYGFITGINGAPYLARNNDYKISTELGISFSYNFTNKTGVFLDACFNYDWFRVATTNYPNSKDPLTYVKFQEYGIKGALGVMTRNVNSYYKFGISFGKNLSNEFQGFSLGMLVAIGFIY